MTTDEGFVPREIPIGVRAIPLEQRETSVPLQIQGRIAATRAVQLKAPASGRVADLTAQLGTHLKAGEVICTIGAAAHRARELGQQAMLHLVCAQLEDRKAELTQALAKGVAPAIEALRAKVRGAESRVKQSTTDVERQRVASEVLRVRSPFDARVAALNTGPGANIVTGQPLAELVAIDPAVLVLEVPTWVASRCEVGRRLDVEVDSKAAPVSGRVARWAPTAVDDVRRLLIEIPNPDGVMAAGERGTATIEVGPRTAFFVPRAALLRDKQATLLQLVEHHIVRIRRVRVVGGDEHVAEVTGDLDGAQLAVVYTERKLVEGCEVVMRGDH